MYQVSDQMTVAAAIVGALAVVLFAAVVAGRAIRAVRGFDFSGPGPTFAAALLATASATFGAVNWSAGTIPNPPVIPADSSTAVAKAAVEINEQRIEAAGKNAVVPLYVAAPLTLSSVLAATVLALYAGRKAYFSPGWNGGK